MDMNERILLLAILKKEQDESLMDAVIKLEDTGLFSLKEGKKLLKNLKKKQYVSDSSLTLKGELSAKKVEAEFKI
jgi:hypothetical protein